MLGSQHANQNNSSIGSEEEDIFASAANYLRALDITNEIAPASGAQASPGSEAGASEAGNKHIDPDAMEDTFDLDELNKFPETKALKSSPYAGSTINDSPSNSSVPSAPPSPRKGAVGALLEEMNDSPSAVSDYGPPASPMSPKMKDRASVASDYGLLSNMRGKNPSQTEMRIMKSNSASLHGPPMNATANGHHRSKNGTVLADSVSFDALSLYSMSFSADIPLVEMEMARVIGVVKIFFYFFFGRPS